MDAPGGDRRPRPGPRAVGSAGRHPDRRRRRGRGHGAAPRRARPGVHGQRGAGQRGVDRPRGRPVRAQQLPPSRAPARDAGQRGVVRRPGLAGRPAARCPRPRGGGRRPAVHARGRADGAAVGLLVPLGRDGRHRAVAAAGLPRAPPAARRPAAVPPRPDVLPARRPPGDRRTVGVGRLRAQGRRGAGARAAGAHRRRGAVVLRQLGGRRPHGRDADHSPAGRATSSRPGASTSSSAASTSSSRPAGAVAASRWLWTPCCRLRRSARSSRRRHGRRPPRSRRAAPRARRAPTARSRPPPGRCGRP